MALRIVFSKLIPFKGYLACTLFDFMFVRKEYKERLGEVTINHELIHQKQSRDFRLGFLGYFLFYPLYLLEWILKLPATFWGYKAYRSISFEQEAFENQENLDYLNDRKRYAWVKYIFKLVK